jgi:hypothetical protein
MPPDPLETCLRRDQHRLRRERDRLRGQQLRGTDVAAAEKALAERIAASADARARRAQSVPALVYPEDLPVSRIARRSAAPSRQHPVVIVWRRDRLGQDHAAAEDLPRSRARRRWRDRPYAAAAHRRARGGGAHRRGAEGVAG